MREPLCGGDLCISPADLKMMGQRIEVAERELAEANAASAEMREALEELLALYYDRAPNGKAIKKTSDDELRKRMEWIGPGTFRVGSVLAARAALSSSAGQSILARLQHLEQAEGLLRELNKMDLVRLYCASGCPLYHSPAGGCTRPADPCNVRRFKDGLVAYLNPPEPKKAKPDV